MGDRKAAMDIRLGSAGRREGRLVVRFEFLLSAALARHFDRRPYLLSALGARGTIRRERDAANRIDNTRRLVVKRELADWAERYERALFDETASYSTRARQQS